MSFQVSGNMAPVATIVREEFGDREKITRAITILGNHTLLMKYAIANDQVAFSLTCFATCTDPT